MSPKLFKKRNYPGEEVSCLFTLHWGGLWMTGLWASSSQCFSILDQTMGKSGWMGEPIDLVTRCNNNQRFPVNGDVFVPCLSLCGPQKERPLSVSLFIRQGPLFLFSTLCTFVAYVFKVRVLRLSFSMVAEGGTVEGRGSLLAAHKAGRFLAIFGAATFRAEL